MRKCVIGSESVPGGGNPIVLAHSGQLLGSTCTSDKCWVEGSQVLSHSLRVVCLGVHRDVENLKSIGLLTQLLARLGQCRKRRGADVGARGKAERQDDHLSAVVAELQFRAVRSAQREIRCCSRRAKNARFETGVVRSTHRSREEEKREQHSPSTLQESRAHFKR